MNAALARHALDGADVRFTVEREQLPGGWLWQVVDSHGIEPRSIPMGRRAALEIAAEKNAEQCTEEVTRG